MSERFSVIIRVIGYLRQLQYEVFNITGESYEQDRNVLGKTTSKFDALYFQKVYLMSRMAFSDGTYPVIIK